MKDSVLQRVNQWLARQRRRELSTTARQLLFARAAAHRWPAAPIRDALQRP